MREAIRFCRKPTDVPTDVERVFFFNYTKYFKGKAGPFNVETVAKKPKLCN